VSEERRSQIIDAAIQVFSKLGFDAARMDDIVSASGLSKGTLYWYYKSKDEIILAILGYLFKQELKDMEALITAEGSASDRLMAFAETTAVNVTAIRRALPIVYEFYALGFRNKTVREGLKSYFQSYIDLMTPLIEQGVANGEFRPVDVHEAVLTAGALLEGTFLLWLIGPEMFEIDKQLKVGFAHFLAGLQNDQRR
jgi:AcrR family transcriptional regulator